MYLVTSVFKLVDLFVWYTEAQEGRWVKPWGTDLADPCSSLPWSENISNRKRKSTAHIVPLSWYNWNNAANDVKSQLIYPYMFYLLQISRQTEILQVCGLIDIKIGFIGILTESGFIIPDLYHSKILFLTGE